MMMSTREVAELFGVTVGTVGLWRQKNIGPSYLELPSGAFRYKRAEVERWYRDNYRVTKEGGDPQ